MKVGVVPPGFNTLCEGSLFNPLSREKVCFRAACVKADTLGNVPYDRRGAENCSAPRARLFILRLCFGRQNRGEVIGSAPAAKKEVCPRPVVAPSAVGDDPAPLWGCRSQCRGRPQVCLSGTPKPTVSWVAMLLPEGVNAPHSSRPIREPGMDQAKPLSLKLSSVLVCCGTSCVVQGPGPIVETGP